MKTKPTITYVVQILQLNGNWVDGAFCEQHKTMEAAIYYKVSLDKIYPEIKHRVVKRTDEVVA